MDIEGLLGEEADSLLSHQSKTIPREDLNLPGPDFIDRVMAFTDRSPQVLRSFQSVFDHGPAGRHLVTSPSCRSTKASSTRERPLSLPTPAISIPRASWSWPSRGLQRGGLHLRRAGGHLRRFAHRIPFIVKLNHNEMLTYPNKFDQVMFGSVEQAFDLGAAGVGATIYFGSDEATRQIQEVAEAFHRAHECGMFTVLWCYLRNSEFKVDGTDYHAAADLTAQANHIGVTIEADIIKQKLPDNNGGYNALGFGKTHPLVYDELTTDHPIDLTRWQVANCYMGRIGMINSGGASSGASDLADAVRTAVINKRAGGLGLISGRKAFQRPFSEGVELLNVIQDVYLSDSVTIA